jgi:hypothetical protein
MNILPSEKFCKFDKKSVIMKMYILAFILVFAFVSARSQTIPTEQQLIRTTGFAVHAAHKAVLSNGVFTGNLSKAIEHQRYAVSQFKSGILTLAVYHSAHARTLALSVIEANSGKINQAFLFTDDENKLIKDLPSESELDKILKDDLKDQDYIDPQLTGIDL